MINQEILDILSGKYGRDDLVYRAALAVRRQRDSMTEEEVAKICSMLPCVSSQLGPKKSFSYDELHVILQQRVTMTRQMFERDPLDALEWSTGKIRQGFIAECDAKDFLVRELRYKLDDRASEVVNTRRRARGDGINQRE